MSPIEFAIAGLILVVFVSWALFGRKPVKENPNCECGGCAVLKKSQEFTPEAPTIPKTALKSMAARERIAQTYDMGRKRKAWARDMDLEREIHDLIGDTREKGDR